MKHQRASRREKVSISIVRRILVLLVMSSLVMGGLMGCDDQTVTITGDPGGDSADRDGDGEELEDDHHGDAEGDHDESFEPSPQEDGETFAAGALQGSWRVAVTEGDKPLAYFDIIQDEGTSSGSGDYLMSIAISEMFDGEAGELIDVAIDSDQVEVLWNPTDDDQEMYRIEVTRETDDRYTGIFTGERYHETHPVTMTRRRVGGSDDRVPTDPR